MTVLEQRFMERVPNLLHDIATSLETMAKQQPKEVWVFSADLTCDCETLGTITEVFATEEAARKYLHEFVEGEEGERAHAEKRDWIIEYDQPDLFQAYEEGRYCTNHTEARVEKRMVKS